MKSLDISVEVKLSKFPQFNDLFSGVALQSADIIHSKIVELLNTPKHGLSYKRKGSDHKASNEGEPPAVDSGNLVNSFDVISMGLQEAKIDSDAEYINLLEEKFNRPLIKPAVFIAEPEIIELVEKRVEERWPSARKR